MEKGWFVHPTIFGNISNTNDVRIAREETFGQVACVIPIFSLDAAVDIANDSHYALAA